MGPPRTGPRCTATVRGGHVVDGEVGPARWPPVGPGVPGPLLCSALVLFLFLPPHLLLSRPSRIHPPSKVPTPIKKRWKKFGEGVGRAAPPPPGISAALRVSCECGLGTGAGRRRFSSRRAAASLPIWQRFRLTGRFAAPRAGREGLAGGSSASAAGFTRPRRWRRSGPDRGGPVTREVGAPPANVGLQTLFGECGSRLIWLQVVAFFVRGRVRRERIRWKGTSESCCAQKGTITAICLPLCRVHAFFLSFLHFLMAFFF